MDTIAAPYRLPLDVDAFRHALSVGAGRAVLQVERHGIDGLEDALFDAVAYCRSVEEPYRGAAVPWLVDLCARAGVLDEWAPRLMSAPRLEGAAANDDRGLGWEIDHEARRRNLAAELARRGFDVGTPDWARDLEEEEDESDGFVWRADTLRQDWRVSAKVRLRFMVVRTDERAAAAYLARVAELGPDDDHSKPDVPQGPDPRKVTLPPVEGWTPAARKRLERVVFGPVEHRAQMRALLRPFYREGDPRVAARALEWVDVADEDLAGRIAYTVGTHRVPGAREVGLEWLGRGGRWSVSGAALLRNNLQRDDGEVVADRVVFPEDPYDSNDSNDTVALLTRALRNAGIGRPEDRPLLVRMHEASWCTCEHCRGDVVRSIVATRAAPDWILDEGRFDVDAGARAAVSWELSRRAGR